MFEDAGIAANADKIMKVRQCEHLCMCQYCLYVSVCVSMCLYVCGLIWAAWCIHGIIGYVCVYLLLLLQAITKLDKDSNGKDRHPAHPPHPVALSIFLSMYLYLHLFLPILHR